jgi:hypothetical protein
MHFFGFSLFFCCFCFFLKNYQNMGQKLGSNKCPLFTMLTKQNSSMFCIVSFVKKRKRKWSHYLGRPAPFEEKWSIFRADLPTHTQSGLFSGATCLHTHTSLFSRVTCPHILTLVYFQERPAHTLTRVYFHGRPAHTYSKWSIFRGDLPTHSHWSIFTSDLPTHTHFGLFSRVTCPFDWVYLRSHLAI